MSSDEETVYIAAKVHIKGTTHMEDIVQTQEKSRKLIQLQMKNLVFQVSNLSEIFAIVMEM